MTEAKLPTYISFSSEVNNRTSESLIAVIANEVQGGASHIYLILSTPGGGTANGIMIYNTLRALPIKLSTHNVGTVNSIGNVIFLAGEERHASPISSFMFHGVGFNIDQAARFEEKDLKVKLDNLTNDQKLIADIITDRTIIDSKKVKRLFLKAEFMRADEARKNGIIHDIRELIVPKGAKFLQLVFNS